jgi:hypothetical protein
MSLFNGRRDAEANELWVSKQEALPFAGMRGKTPALPQQKSGEKGF